MDFLKKLFKRPKFYYKYTAFFVLLVVIMIAAIIIVKQFMLLTEANLKLSKSNELLTEKFNEIIEVIRDEDDNLTVIKSDIELLKEDALSEVEGMRLFREEFSAFKSDWQSFLTIFTIILSFFAVVIPIFNYVFVVKDQLCSYHDRFKKMQDEFEIAKTKAINDLEIKYSNIDDELIEHENNIKILIEEATNITQKDTEFAEEKIESLGETKLKLSIRASREFRSENYSEALKIYTRLIELDSKNASYYARRGVIYHRLKRYEKSLKDFDKAIKFEPEKANYYDNRGSTYLKMKKYYESIKDRTQAIKLEPENAIYYNNRGVSYSWLKKYEESLKDCKKAIELDPENAYYIVTYANMSFKVNGYKDAIKEVNKALEIDDTLAYGYRIRGKIELKNAKLSNQDCPKEALDDFNKTIELDEPSYNATHNYHSRAEYYLYVGEKEKAYDDLQKSLELNDTNEFAYFYLSKYWEKQGNKKEAKENYDLAIKYGYVHEDDE